MVIAPVFALNAHSKTRSLVVESVQSTFAVLAGLPIAKTEFVGQAIGVIPVLGRPGTGHSNRQAFPVGQPGSGTRGYAGHTRKIQHLPNLRYHDERWKTNAGPPHNETNPP